MEENKPRLYGVPTPPKKVVNNIKTYLSDMADAMRENQGSVIKIAMAEKNKKDQEEIYKEAKVMTTSKLLLVMAGVLLILGGIIFSVYLWKKNNVVSTTEIITKSLDAVISYDTSSYTDMSSIVSRADFINLLKKELKADTKPQSIRSMFLITQLGETKSITAFSQILPLLNFSMPDSLQRSLTGRYMLGTYTSTEIDAQTNTNKPYLFLILQTKDYNNAYAGMLAWEGTLLDDMFPIFGIDMSGDNKQLLGKPFKDILIDNKDARILADKDGNGLLYYILPDKENIVITNSEEAIKEIKSRLITKKIKPL